MTRGDRNEESNKLEPCPGCNQAFALDSTSTSAGHAVIESGWMNASPSLCKLEYYWTDCLYQDHAWHILYFVEINIKKGTISKLS